jgi:hypothetical protein
VERAVRVVLFPVAAGAGRPGGLLLRIGDGRRDQGERSVAGRTWGWG